MSQNTPERTQGIDTPSRSQTLYERATRVLPGGVSRNTIYRKPRPDYFAYGKGCRVVDLDGNERIDFSNNMASLIHGHADDRIVSAVTEQLRLGSAVTLATEAEVRYAELLCGRVPGFDKIRFTNSGTEAVMAMIKAARAFTGRPKIAKVEGAYHGSYDYAEVSQTSGPANWGEADRPASVPVAVGTPAKALEDVVVLPFNDPDRAIALLDQHAGDIAAVLLDPLPHRVGMCPASSPFVEAIHAWTRTHSALMIFDEVITFRNGFAGTQETYAVKPDLTAMGKMIGGGFPVGAVAGCDEVMAVFDPASRQLPLPHSGTFSANPITMTAGRVAMECFDAQANARLNALGDLVRAKIADAIAAAGVPACVTGAGSLLRVHLRPAPPRHYREAYLNADETKALSVLLDHAYDHGVLMINTCSAALSTAMTEAEIDHLAAVLADGFERIRGLLPA